jgi:hypothetical protein
MFSPGKTIIDESKPKKVIYGTMNQSPRSFYEILQPYLLAAANKTTEAAEGIYNALSNGASWLYGQLINRVIPYTREELPKWFFVTQAGKKEEKLGGTQSFQVLEVDPKDYNELKNKEKNKRKSRIIIPLDGK